jgi:Flp pilus assembly protein TadG
MAGAKAPERGATLLMVAFVSIFLLIPIIGTCVDGAIVYWAQRRLSVAVDAAALAAARALSVEQSDSAQLRNAQATGRNYFRANFPPGVMNTTVVGGVPSSAISESVTHQKIVTVSASITVPLYFMPVLGFKNQIISATGRATTRDSNMMLASEP